MDKVNNAQAGMQLYLIALLFPDAVNERVRMVQREVAQDFGFRRSLNKPVHITLVPPFKAPEAFEKEHHLAQVAEQSEPFKLELKDFGCFPNPTNPVLFINIVENEALRQLYKNIEAQWKAPVYPAVQWQAHFHPHVTISYRENNSDRFSELWDKYKDRPFDSIFVQDSFTLLRWENFQWQPVQHFSFAKTVRV